MALENSMLVIDGKQIGGRTEDMTAYQTRADNSLQTTDKMVVGAINEHEGDIDSLKNGLTSLQSLASIVYSLKELTLGSEASGSVQYTQSDFTIPSGYVTYWKPVSIMVYANWGIAVNHKERVSGGNNFITNEAPFYVDVETPVTGGNVTITVILGLQIYKNS